VQQVGADGAERAGQDAGPATDAPSFIGDDQTRVGVARQSAGNAGIDTGRFGALEATEREGNRFTGLNAHTRDGTWSLLESLDDVARGRVLELAVHLAEVTAHAYRLADNDSFHGLDLPCQS